MDTTTICTAPSRPSYEEDDSDSEDDISYDISTISGKFALSDERSAALNPMSQDMINAEIPFLNPFYNSAVSR